MRKAATGRLPGCSATANRSPNAGRWRIRLRQKQRSFSTFRMPDANIGLERFRAPSISSTNDQEAGMTENTDVPDNKRNIWTRLLFMLLIALAFHVCVTVLG